MWTEARKKVTKKERERKATNGNLFPYMNIVIYEANFVFTIIPSDIYFARSSLGLLQEILNTFEVLPTELSYKKVLSLHKSWYLNVFPSVYFFNVSKNFSLKVLELKILKKNIFVWDISFVYSWARRKSSKMN